jgi:PDZ domain-containing secreted protein
MEFFPKNSTILVFQLLVDMPVFSKKSSKGAPKKAFKKAAKKATKVAYKKAAKKAVKYAKKGAYKTHISDNVKRHAKKILHSIDEAEKIHRGEKKGISFDDFLAGF